jgi:hypothetical protein
LSVAVVNTSLPGEPRSRASLAGSRPGELVSSWMPAWRDALLAVLVARALTWTVAAVAAEIGGPAFPYPEDLASWAAAGTVRWDAFHFQAIAENGYPTSIAREWAFWPGYPLLTRALGGGWVAGVLVAVACSVAALALLWKLAAEAYGAATARRAVWLIALFPGGLFLGAYYSESLFLLETVAAVYAARRGRWVLAGLLGAAAALTRSIGVLIVLPLAWEAWQARPGRRAAWLLLVPIAPLAFFAWGELRADDWLVPLHAQKLWSRGWHGPLGALPDALDQAKAALGHPFGAVRGDDFEPGWFVIGQFILFVGAVAATVGALRLQPGWGAYALAAIAVPLLQPWPDHPLLSFPRFLSVLFPLFVWLALRTRRRAVFAAVLGAWVVGLGVLSARFGLWVWAG